MDTAAKRKVLRKFTYGLFLITSMEDGEVNGFTANWITQASFEPPMVVFAMENDTRSIEMIRNSKAYVVNVMPTGAREFAGQMGRSSQQDPNKMQDVKYRPGPETGAPVLEDSSGWLECRLVSAMPAGDHTLLLGEIVEAGLGNTEEPLTMTEAGFRYSG